MDYKSLILWVSKINKCLLPTLGSGHFVGTARTAARKRSLSIKKWPLHKPNLLYLGLNSLKPKINTHKILSEGLGESHSVGK